MSRIVVNGGRKLLGEIDIQGAKETIEATIDVREYLPENVICTI